jgi:non-specific serine/threonine protein kinase
MVVARVDEILDRVLDLAEPDRRSSARSMCAGDDATLREVLSLLDAFEAAPSFLAPLRRIHEPLPSSLGRYRVREELGRGASGVVYLAEDPDLDRPVAIKVLALSGGSTSAARLRDEARLLASISQPNVAAVYAIEDVVVRQEGPSAPAAPTRLALIMEYVPGETLAGRLRSGPLSIEASLDGARQIAAGLEAAHARSIVHRDLKPQNIRITPAGWVKILDFGLATARADAATPAGIEGTPGYMSPEQAEGAAADERSDLWALGVILFECLSGAPAVPGESLTEILARTRSAEIRWKALPPATPDRVVAALRSCLDRDVSRRVASATDLRHLLENELLRLRATRLIDPAVRSARPGSVAPPRPPLQAPVLGSAAPGNLPATWSSFVGRDSVLETLARLAGDHRLLTLTGAGGVGKTRTALELAARIRDRFQGGVWFIDLSELSDGAAVASAAARALALKGVRARAPEEAIAENVADALAGREALLVLDNCEHVVESTGRFCLRLLERCPGVRLVATSRAPLAVPGEQTFGIVPLELPAREDPEARARTRDAVRLFESRARLRDPSFELDPARLRTTVEIVSHLDGLPLAIELAAGHVRLMPLEEIRRTVVRGGTLAVRTGGRPARHRSLADLVNWSYRLLRPEEQRLFARLAVFRGGWTLEAAEAVCAGEGIEPWQACEAMSRLVEESLVETEPRAGGPDAPAAGRYRLLETIRSVAESHLGAPAAAREAVESRYLSFLVALATPGAGELATASSAWVHRIETEYANLQHALEIALARRLDAAMRLGSALGRYWAHVGYWSEGLASLGRLAETWRRAGDDRRREVDPRDVITVLSTSARLAARLEMSARSRELAAESVSLARDLGERRALAGALRAAGGAAWFRADIDQAETCWQEALGLYRAIGDAGAAALCVGNLGGLCTLRGDHAAAEEHYRVLLSETEALSDRLGVARALLNLGRSVLELGRPADALPRLERALALFRELKDALGVATALHGLGDVHLALGDPERARGHLLESARVRDGLGQKGAILEVVTSLARVAESENRDAHAAALLRGVLRAYASGIPHLERERRAVEAHLRSVQSRAGVEALSAEARECESLAPSELVAWTAARTHGEPTAPSSPTAPA